ncbi:MAG TPA: hypothetical protein VF077_01030 [Nitrospiraceae bacterium]
MKNIRTSMMLGNLSIGVWTASIGAKGVSRKAETEANAKEGTIKATKKLMAGVLELEAVQKSATAHRNWWNLQSVPWFDNGPRGYNASRHMDLCVEVGDRKREHEGLVKDFLKLYPSLRASRQFDMGEFFDEKEFPTPDIVGRKFHFDFETSPVPNNEDIRIIDALPKADIDAMIQAGIEQENAKVRAGMQVASERLATVVAAMHKKLSVKIGDTGHIFRDSLIENIAQLVEIMPGLNITGDPALAQMCKEAKKLTLYSPDELREDEDKRAKAAKEAKSLATKLSGLFADE